MSRNSPWAGGFFAPDDGELRIPTYVRAAIITGMSEVLMCPYCEERIGVYEPVIVLGHAGTRRTSLAAEPEIRAGQTLILHAACTPDA